MGFTLPSADAAATPKEQAKALMAQKDNIETEIETHISVLRANQVDMQTPLVDREGFPRADIDVFAVRAARVRIIELRNDLKAVMDAIGKALEGVFDPTLVSASSQTTTGSQDQPQTLGPFARVDGVAPGSPAAQADLRRGDLIIKFGALDRHSFPSSSLQPLSEYVPLNENRAVSVRVLRGHQTVFLTFTPRKDWGGRGMLGCHIVPYSPPN